MWGPRAPCGMHHGIHLGLKGVDTRAPSNSIDLPGPSRDLYFLTYGLLVWAVVLRGEPTGSLPVLSTGSLRVLS